MFAMFVAHAPHDLLCAELQTHFELRMDGDNGTKITLAGSFEI